MEQTLTVPAREGNRLEAKLAKGGVPASVWETYSAFANTEGGTIVLGARENANGEIECVGVSDPDALVKKFWDAVNNPSKVSVNLLTSNDVSIQEMNGCSVVIIDVPRANRQARPVFVGKDRDRGTYRRNGEGDYRCSSEEVLAMIRDASPAPLDAAVLEEFSLQALSGETVRRFCAAVEAVRPKHPWLGLSFEDLLVKLNAAGRTSGDGELHPTRAGLLMFGFEYEIVREFPDYFLDYREMVEGSRWADRIVSHDGTWSGNVFDFWLDALPRLTAGLKRPFALDGNLQRIEDTEMHAAVREVFVNALVHADYYGRRGVVVLRYPDRIEIANPGSSRVALDVMVAGGVSDARNPTMMKMFGLLNACEKAGSGFDVMRSAAFAAGANPPEARESFDPDRLAVTVFFGAAAATDSPGHQAERTEGAEPLGQSRVPRKLKVSRGSEDRAGAPRREAVLGRPADERQVVALASGRDSITRRDVENLLSCGPTKAKGILGKLVSDGLLESTGAARSTRYRMVADDRFSGTQQ